jgi:hypothetical protein
MESTIAEKFQAMVRLGVLNSRIEPPRVFRRLGYLSPTTMAGAS